MMNTLIRDNQACLQQGLELLAQLDDTAYARPEPVCFNSSIGGHLRHNIDHYAALLEHHRSGKVDYDARQRDPQLEQSTAQASFALQGIAKALDCIEEAELDRPLQVKMDTGSEDSDNWACSSLRRELQFLLSHTVHHYALIATICQLAKVNVPEGFGIAPSTLHYKARLAAS